MDVVSQRAVAVALFLEISGHENVKKSRINDNLHIPYTEPRGLDRLYGDLKRGINTY